MTTKKEDPEDFLEIYGIRKLVVGRKSYECAHCREMIKKGEKHRTVATKFLRAHTSGEYYETYRFHLSCPETTRI